MGNLYTATLVADRSSIGNDYVNVFQFDVDDVLPSSAVATALANSIWLNYIQNGAAVQPIAAIVHSSTIFRSVTVKCPFDPSVLGIKTGTQAGGRSGDVMPNFVAWRFKQPRKRGDIRHGFKAFGAVSEADVTGGLPATAMVSVINAASARLCSILSISDGVSTYSATPVIAGRIEYTPSPGRKAYRFPESPAEYRFYTAVDWGFYLLSTQNSRKL